jgi:hypothetical protein
MFISDKIVFVELHKTGGTHIGKLLANLVGGEQVGKHNPATADLFTPGRSFLGSVRNPWDWYVSLWGFGCDGRGALFLRVTKPRWEVKARAWRHPRGTLRSLYRDLGRRPDQWHGTYTHADDAPAFRRWLRMVHDERRRPELGEGYAASPLSAFAGLLTYRYVSLFCRNGDAHEHGRALTSLEALRTYERAHCYVDRFIRNERLEHDLVQALLASGIPLTEAQQQYAFSQGRTNTSSRKRSAAYYYDEDTVRLVADRERFIVEKFGYEPPAL